MRSRLLVALSCASAVAAAATAGATAPESAHRSVVSAVPAAGPQIVDGTVHAVTQVGDVVLAGGTFTSVQSGSGTVARSGLVAWDTAGRGVLGFAPVLDGPVRTLLPGLLPGTVYVGGNFGRVNGVAARGLVLLDLATGQRVEGFSPGIQGTVQTVERSGSRLFVGGTFSRVGGSTGPVRGGIAAVDASSGAPLPSLTGVVSENHSWTVERGADGQVKAPVGVDRLDVTPDGRRLVAIGNFRKVDGQPRDQVAMWDISGPTSALLAWHPPQYDRLCGKKYDSYVRDVDFSPDGSYLVIATTGGKFAGSLCDTAARFETAGTGLAITPTWVAASGADSLLSTAVTGEAVYVGGHQRWLNNPNGGDIPAAGAVPRPGVAALDPVNGLPLAWNPGRHPRGNGTYALYATPTGLWMGSDTNYVGNRRYRAQKIAFFPLAGGRPSASKELPGLPAGVYTGAGAATLRLRSFDGSVVGTGSTVEAPFDVSQLRGTTTVGQTLFYGKADGLLYERSLSPSGAFGPEALVDPYHDPDWSTVVNGSLPPLVPENQTYRGVRPTFYADPPTRTTSEIARLTSMFYDGSGRLYYTLQGSTGLFYRSFSPDVQRRQAGVTTGGVLYPNRTRVANVSLPPVTGAFLADGVLYYAKKADGRLYRVPFVGGRPSGAHQLAEASSSWATSALFLLPGGTPG